MAQPITIPTNTFLVTLNTLSTFKTVTLPVVSTNPGRILVLKDMFGNASVSTIRLSTIGLDRIERSNISSMVLSNAYAAYWFGNDGITNWFLTDAYLNSMVLVQPQVGWLPTQVAGLQAWYDGNDTAGNGSSVANNTSISTWVDKSGQSRSATNNATAAVTVTNALNGRTVVRCNGTNNYLITYSSFPVSGYTIYTVQTSTNNGTYRRVIHAPAGGDAAIFLGVLNDNVATFTGNASSAWNDINANSPGVSNFNNPRIVGMWVSGSTLTPYVDGTAQNNKTGTTGAFNNLNIAFSGGQGWIGDIAEILIYSSALTTTPRQQVEGYLAWKWGLQANLPSGHPYKNAPP